MKNLHSVSAIAIDRGIMDKRHLIIFAIKNLKLTPVARDGNNRLYDDAQRVLIEAELDRVIKDRIARTSE